MLFYRISSLVVDCGVELPKEDSSSSIWASVSRRSFLYSNLDLASASLKLVEVFCWINFSVKGYGEILEIHSRTLDLVAFSGLNSCHHFTLNFLPRASGNGGFWIRIYSQQVIHDKATGKRN